MPENPLQPSSTSGMRIRLWKFPGSKIWHGWTDGRDRVFRGAESLEVMPVGEHQALREAAQAMVDAHDRYELSSRATDGAWEASCAAKDRLRAALEAS